MRVLSVNQFGTYLGVRTAIGPMKTAGGGSIINISSIDGLHSSAGLIAYSSSKWGVRGLTKCAASELGQHGIRVNASGPGPTLPHSRQSEDGCVHHWRATPLGRQVTPEDICHGVRYILDAATMTGQMIALDAGEHLGGEHK